VTHEVLLLTALTALPASALQVNIEKSRVDEDRLGFWGSGGLDMSIRTGNVELVAFGMAGVLGHSSQAFTTFVVSSGDFGWAEGQEFFNEALIHVRGVYAYRPRLRPEAFVQLNYDKARLLTFRGLVGGGLRITLLRREATQLWWGTAYLFEHEELDLEPGAVHPPSTSAHRWSNYLSSTITIVDRTTLGITVYVQPRFDDPADVRVLSEGRLSVVISGPISLVVTFRAHYDSRPPEGVVRLDTKSTTGFVVAF
jgi:hypothetical protein